MLQLLQLKATPERPPFALTIKPNLDRHLLDCADDAVALEDSNRSRVIFPSVLLLLVVGAAEKGEHLRWNCGSLFLITAKEVRDAQSVVARNIAQAYDRVRVERVWLASHVIKGVA